MTVLIADDDKSVVAAVKLLLKAEGLDSVACNTSQIRCPWTAHLAGRT